MEKLMKSTLWGKIFFVVIALNLLLLVYVAFIKQDALSLETMKVGGRDNMQLVQKLYSTDAYKNHQQQALQEALDGMDTTNPTQAPAKEDTVGNVNWISIDTSTISKLKEGSYVEGNEDAKITILEYSEFLCSYCKRQSDNKIMEQLVAKYGKDVNVIFKHYIVHPGAEVLAQASQCVGEQKGTKVFYQFLSKVFDLEDRSEDSIVKLAKSFGAKEDVFEKCLSSEKYANFVIQSTNDGRSLFGVKGTPGNVILNNETGEYTIIAGAYPLDSFVQAIDKMLGK